MSPQEAMPVVMKRDSLEAMGPVVGEELLVAAAAEAAKENSESSSAAGNSTSTSVAVEGGGLGESDYELSMTDLMDCPPTSAGLDGGLTGGWTVWSYDD